MKSLLLTAFLSTGVAHTGAFLTVWELPYVQDHFTFNDLTRKLDKVFEVGKTSDTLRNARAEAAEENYAIFQPKPRRGIIKSTGYTLSGGTNRSSRRR